MIYYIEPDGKTVTEHESISSLPRDYRASNLFAIHPDENPLLHKRESGRYAYTSPTGVTTVNF